MSDFKLVKPTYTAGGAHKISRPKFNPRPSDPEPDPLAKVEYTGDLSDDAKTEFEAIDDAYRARAKAESDRFKLATDSEYWVCVCFVSREDKEAWSAKHGIDPNSKYVDGYDLP